jgi:hypothetical protein
MKKLETKPKALFHSGRFFLKEGSYIYHYVNEVIYKG